MCDRCHSLEKDTALRFGADPPGRPVVVPNDLHGDIRMAETLQFQVVLPWLVHEDHRSGSGTKGDARNDIAKLMQGIMKVRRGHLNRSLPETNAARCPARLAKLVLHPER